MLISESELVVLGMIHENPDITPPDLATRLNGKLSKTHVYLMLSRLEEKDLVQIGLIGGGSKGPLRRTYKLNPRGKRVRKLATELSTALQQDQSDRIAVAG